MTQATERQIIESVDIAAPPERVFRALTDPAEVAAWWGDPTTAPATHWELDARAGGRWLSTWKNVADGTEFAIGGEVLEYQPPNLLVVTWWDDRYPGLDHTTVEYRIDRLATGGSRLRVTHSGFDGTRADFDDYSGGWSMITTHLRAYAEAAEAADPQVVFTGNRDVAIEVPDLARAEEFYAGTLGFHVRARGENHLELDAGAFTLWVNRVTGPRRPFIPSLDVPDLAKAREYLEEAGCRILKEVPDGRGFYFECPFGFVMDVVEKR